MEHRINGPPQIEGRSRIAPVSYLPPRSMPRAYRSELRRRELLDAAEAEWRRLAIDIALREASEAAFEKLVAAFAALFSE
jgi:hypothetical protein